MGELITMPLAGSVALPDVRGEHRTLQVTWHGGERVVVLSTWRFGRCVATVRLSRQEVAALIGLLAEGLAGGA